MIPIWTGLSLIFYSWISIRWIISDIGPYWIYWTLTVYSINLNHKTIDLWFKVMVYSISTSVHSRDRGTRSESLWPLASPTPAESADNVSWGPSKSAKNSLSRFLDSYFVALPAIIHNVLVILVLGRISTVIKWS